MHENVYWIGLWQDPDYWLVGPRLSNTSFSGTTPLFSVDEWDLSP